MSSVYTEEVKIENAWARVRAERVRNEEARRLAEEETKNRLRGLFVSIGKSREKFKVNEDEMKRKRAEEEQKAKEVKRVELMKRRWKLSNVPEAFRKSALTPFVQSPVEKQDKIDFLNQSRVINILKTFNPLATNAVFYGFYGLGKSYFASFFVRKVIVEGKRAGFVSASDYIRFCKKDLVRAERMEEMDFLVLDEVGNSDIPDWDLMHLKDLLIRRGNKGLRTLITTNLSMWELTKYLKGTAQDRMLNSSTFYVDFNQVDGACSLRGRM